MRAVAALQPSVGRFSPWDSRPGGPAVSCVVASNITGLVALEEHLPTSHLLSEGPGSRWEEMCPVLCPPPWLGTYMGVGT